jgi:flagellar basal-body rod modification protein FlgD
MILGTATESAAVDTSKSSEAGAKLEDDLNRFLNILVTQLQNQDPLDPLDANEFTSQLVQFASVEQQIYQNSNLEKMLNLQETSQISEMVDFIGNRVEFFGQTLPLENSLGEFSYVMPAGVKEGTVNIANSSGINVFFAEADTNQGKHTISWDGVDKKNRQLPDGDYTVLVTGTDAKGNLVQIEHLMTGTVNGAGVDDGKVKLFLGDSLIIEQDKILSVHKPATAESASNDN